ncbi:MAG: hypothetical protein ACE363_15405 [Alphaproteobacteria bacterium]
MENNNIPLKTPKRAIVAGTLLILAACGVIGPSNEDRDRLLTAFFTTLSERWNAEDVEPMLTTEAYRTLSSQQQAQMLRVMSQLGRLQSLGPFHTNHVSASVGAGTQARAAGSGTFENGEATITVNMTYEDDELRIQGFNINSPLFLQLMDPGATTNL